MKELFTTNRLIVRKFTKEDDQILLDLLGNPLVMEFSLKGPLDLVETRKYLESRILNHYEKYNYGLWALIDKKTERLVGFAGMIEWVIEEQEMTELAYRLHPDFWKRGLAKEACEGIIRYVKEKYGMSQLISLISEDNTPSMKLSEKLGFSKWKKTNFHGFEVWIMRKYLENV